MQNFESAHHNQNHVYDFLKNYDKSQTFLYSNTKFEFIK